MFSNYTEVEPLLRVPVVLAMVRELAEADAVRTFRTRGDLYLQVHENLTARAARKLGLHSDGDHLVRWCEILAATADRSIGRGLATMRWWNLSGRRWPCRYSLSALQEGRTGNRWSRAAFGDQPSPSRCIVPRQPVLGDLTVAGTSVSLSASGVNSHTRIVLATRCNLSSDTRPR